MFSTNCDFDMNYFKEKGWARWRGTDHLFAAAALEFPHVQQHAYVTAGNEANIQGFICSGHCNPVMHYVSEAVNIMP